MIHSLFLSPFNIIVIKVYAPTTDVWRSWRWLVLWRTLRSSRTSTIKWWNEKVGSQEISGVTGKFGPGIQNEARQRLTEFCRENMLVIANTLFQQHKRCLYTRTSPVGQYQNQIDYILCSRRWSSSIRQQKQDLELIVAEIISSLLQNSGLNWTK